MKHTTCTYIPNPKNGAYFYKTPLSQICPHRSFVLHTYSDFSAKSLNPQFCQTPLQNAGLVPVSSANEKGVTLGFQMRSVLLKLLFNPSQELCTLINDHLAVLKQKTMIGIQIRLGGQRANFVEKMMMPTQAIDAAQQRVEWFLYRKKLRYRDLSVFLSSDSDYAIRRLRAYFQKHNTPIVVTADEFAVGHSAEAKTGKRGRDKWMAFTKRAIMDMMILKESDYLIFTKKSSFGRFSYELQQSYANPMSVSSFLKQRGMNCSVFYQRQHVGEWTALA